MTGYLEHLADLALDAGCGLVSGQTLVIASPVEAIELTRVIARRAWERGAADVAVFHEDPDLLRLRLSAPGDGDVDRVSAAQLTQMATAMAEGAARISILAPRPDLLSGIEPERIMQAHRAFGEAAHQARTLMNDTIAADTAIPFATESWARLVFDGGDAVAKLHVALATALRFHNGNPSGYRDHLEDLARRRDALTAGSFQAIHLRGSRTDLTLALSQPARWCGGTLRASSGQAFVPMLPTEGVSSLLRSEGTQGRIAFSRPLALAGGVVEGLEIKVEGGEIVDLAAQRGGELIEGLLSEAPEARRLTGVTLVDQSSPAAGLGIRFFNPLLDSCCACSLALGEASTGAAESAKLHLDAMFGDETLEIVGVTRGGDTIPVMRSGFFLI